MSWARPLGTLSLFEHPSTLRTYPCTDGSARSRYRNDADRPPTAPITVWVRNSVRFMHFSITKRHRDSRGRAKASARAKANATARTRATATASAST